MNGLLGDGKGAANPLKQLGNREGIDRSLFQDRHVGQGPSSSRASRPHHHQAAGHAPHAPQPFNLSHLSSALSQPDFSADWARASHRPSPPAATGPSALASEYQQWAGPASRSDWAQSYDPKGKGRMITAAQDQQAPQLASAAHHYRPFQPSMMGQSGFAPMYQGANFAQHQAAGTHRQMDQVEQEKMELAFERALADAREQSGTVEQRTQDTGEVPAEETEEFKGNLEAVWESLRPEAERLNKLAEWERDFSQFTNDEDDLFETLNESLHRDDVGQHTLDEQFEGLWDPEQGVADREDLSREFNEWKSRAMPENGLPETTRYDFSNATATQFDHLSPDESWRQANELLATGGSLSDVALHLENYLRRARAEPTEQASLPATEVEAWSLLGRVHAMDEKEDKALAAFEAGRKALEQPDRDTRGAGEMLTNLAISYVNESEDLAALTTLHQFLHLLHPSFAGPAPSRSQMTESESPWSLHQNLTDSFLALARDQYNSKGEVDPDVQVGLGTAYYMMGEYEEARKCWVAALGEKPDDYLLWNRLGATLANGGNPEEAVDAYRRALELKPTFTRAIFNLGVACLNIGVHKEAAEHFLAALSMHTQLREEDAKIYDSLSIWSTLRRALVAMDLNDLAAKANPGADLEVFRQAGFTF